MEFASWSNESENAVDVNCQQNWGDDHNVVCNSSLAEMKVWETLSDWSIELFQIILTVVQKLAKKGNHQRSKPGCM